MKQNSVIAITGANSGMGKAASAELAKTGATVIMLCRCKDRGQEALNDVRVVSNNDTVELMICDLGSLSGIKDFCSDFKIRFNRLDVLINNAGVILPGYHQTADGYELHFGVNHLRHFFLTDQLSDILTASAPARVVNVSSGMHKIGKIHLDDINLKHNYSFWRAYAQSKLANVLFTYELAERMKGKGVTANCLHPGGVATNMGINRETGFGTFITQRLKPLFQTPEQGAETTVYLAASQDVEGVTGKYYYHKKPVLSSKKSYDKDLAEKLWDLSQEMVRKKL